jgi:hypothetical protein
MGHNGLCLRTSGYPRVDSFALKRFSIDHLVRHLIVALHRGTRSLIITASFPDGPSLLHFP